MSTLNQLHSFWGSVDRDKFYDIYGVMTALSGPACGDFIQVGDEFFNLKRVVRIMRITVMGPRFKVDYAEPYTINTINQEISHCRLVYAQIHSKEERESLVKIIKALEVIRRWLGDEPAAH